MAVNLKTATPDTTIPSDGFLFGADSQSASAPSVYPMSALISLLFGSTSFSGSVSNTLVLSGGATAQNLYVYNTYTDASNYERGVIDWSSSANVLTIGTANSGTGSARNIRFVSGGVNKLDYGVTLPDGWYTPTAFMAGGLMIGSGFYGLPAASVALSTNNGSSALTLETSSATFTQPASAPTLRTSTAYTVATLPNAATVGAGTRAFVTDATATTFMSVVAGGGANKVPVISDGADWRIA